MVTKPSPECSLLNRGHTKADSAFSSECFPTHHQPSLLRRQSSTCNHFRFLLHLWKVGREEKACTSQLEAGSLFPFHKFPSGLRKLKWLAWVFTASIRNHILILGVTPDTVVPAACCSVATQVPEDNQGMSVHLLSREQNSEQSWNSLGPGDVLRNNSPQGCSVGLGECTCLGPVF